MKGGVVKSIGWEQVCERTRAIVDRYPKGTAFYGIPRGGAIIAAILLGMGANVVQKPEEADVIVDDIYDSGATTERYRKYCKPFAYIIDKRREHRNAWISFPWEDEVQKDAEDHVARLIQSLGEDISRDGLVDTPKRYVKFLREFLAPPEFNMTTFENEGTDEMVLVSGIDFESLCEHHIAPFIGKGAIGYLPNKKLVGISKMPRTLEMFSRRLQNQERITEQVADYLVEKLEPYWVGVHLAAQHTCMTMRGVRKPGAMTSTTAFRGPMKDDLVLRGEFFNRLKEG